VIDAITSTIVQVIGDFPPGRKRILKGLQKELRKHQLQLVVLNFKEYADGIIAI
jgi:hypothetical protein